METKLLDLNAFGVEEMSVAEMQMIDGGVGTILRKLGKKLIESYLIDLTKSAISSAWSAYVDFWSGEGGAAVRQQSLAAGR